MLIYYLLISLLRILKQAAKYKFPSNILTLREKYQNQKYTETFQNEKINQTAKTLPLE